MSSVTYEQVIEQIKALPPEALPVISELVTFLALLDQAKDWDARRLATLRKFNYDRAAIMREMAKLMEQAQQNASRLGLSEDELETDIRAALEEVRAERRARQADRKSHKHTQHHVMTD